jgi:Reverse transcriptase (RNA-dependent DNA polymerase)
VWLVLLGYLQHPDIGNNETYSPVADFTVIRALLAKTVSSEWLVHQMDVTCAFLNGILDEDIYTSRPREYAHPQDLVCKLQKSIYGLKQAPRPWNKKFTSDLRKSGFIPLVNAESAFTGTFLAETVFSFAM